MASTSFEYAQDLIKHNLVVFRNGAGALQILPNLIDVLPEARLNLVIFFLREGEIREAYELMKDLEPTTPQVSISDNLYNSRKLLLISLLCPVVFSTNRSIYSRE